MPDGPTGESVAVNPLRCGFFHHATPEIARALLGCRLCRRVDGATLRWPITETEAYDGPEDGASHARAGRTPRTEVMFGPPGIWYVYLCYGVHWLLNIVTGPVDYPAAVLIRGAGEARGPGRLTRAMKVDGALNRQHACPASGLWIEPGPPPAEAAIRTTPRIGVDYAGPDWAGRHYRFLLESMPVSRR